MSQQQHIIGDRFELTQEIGKGGMGTVYQGLDLKTRQPVAIKALKEEVIQADPILLARFEREGEALRQLNHPNIVKVLATISEGNDHYLVMEYIGGGSLSTQLERFPNLPIKQILRIGLGVADALVKTHALGIIHRDIKPSNILLTEGGTPRLTDFGVAHTEQSHLTQTGTMMGTLGYLSPEAFQQLTLDARADIWSFGITMYEMLTGHRPFRGDNFAAVMQAVMTQAVPDLERQRPDAPLALIDVVYRMLEKRRELRIPDMNIVGAELESILHNLPATSPNLRVLSRLVMTGEQETARFKVQLKPPAGEIPPLLTPFIGRERELHDLEQLVTEQRLVTIVGPGGVGKSRLAMAFGEANRGNFAHGVYYVPTLGSPDLVLAAIAEAVGYIFANDSRSQRVQLLDHLRYKSVLLLLDNFGQASEGASILDDIRRSAHDARIVVTSRQPLEITGEAVFQLGGLPYRPWRRIRTALEYASVQVFAHHARFIHFDWELTDANVEPLSAVCEQVDGNPLALELAARALRYMPVAQIANEIQRYLGFMTSDMRHQHSVQPSLRAAFEILWDTLTEDDQQTLAKLGIFEGGFMREAAQEVTGAALRSLITLVDNGLLQRNALGRYHLHPVIREFVIDHAKEQITTAYTSYYADFTRRRRYELRGHHQQRALVELDIELQNIRKAWHWALEHGQLNHLSKMINPLSKFYAIRGRFQEALELFGAGAEAMPAPPIDEAKRLVWARLWMNYGAFLHAVGATEQSLAYLEESLTTLRTMNKPEDLAWCLYFWGQAADNREAFEEALRYSHEVNDPYLTVRVLNVLAAWHGNRLNMRDCTELLEESLRLAQNNGDTFGEAEAWRYQATYAIQTGDYAAAEDCHHNLLDFYRTIEDRTHIAQSLTHLGGIQLLLGDFGAAKTHLLESINITRKTHDIFTLGTGLAYMGLIGAVEGDYEEAIDLCERSLSIARSTHNTQGEVFANLGIGHALTRMNDYRRAERYLVSALQRATLPAEKLAAFIDVALILATRGQPLPAARLLGVYLKHPAHLRWQTEDPTFLLLQTKLQEQLAPETYAEALSLEHDLDSAVEEIISAFRGHMA